MIYFAVLQSMCPHDMNNTIYIAFKKYAVSLFLSVSSFGVRSVPTCVDQTHVLYHDDLQGTVFA